MNVWSPEGRTESTLPMIRMYESAKCMDLQDQSSPQSIYTCKRLAGQHQDHHVMMEHDRSAIVQAWGPSIFVIWGFDTL